MQVEAHVRLPPAGARRHVDSPVEHRREESGEGRVEVVLDEFDDGVLLDLVVAYEQLVGEEVDEAVKTVAFVLVRPGLCVAQC